VCQQAQGVVMSPKSNLLRQIVSALFEAEESVLQQIMVLLSGGKTEWRRLLDSCGVSSAVGFSEDRFPLETSPSVEGLREFSFPQAFQIVGKTALNEASEISKNVGPGSAMKYISERKCKGSKLVFTGCCWVCEDGYEYVVVYDRREQTIILELVSELDQTYSFLVRS